MSNARKPAVKPAETPTISEGTARFLLGLVNSITLTVNAPDFDESVVQVLTARAELVGIVGVPDGE